MIHFLCSNCKKALKAQDDSAGKKCKCKCGTINEIPRRVVQPVITPEIPAPFRLSDEPPPLVPIPKPKLDDYRTRPTTSVARPSLEPEDLQYPAQIVTQKKDDNGTDFLGALGALLVLGGILGALYFLFVFDTSVSVSSDTAEFLGTRRVHNIGLMNDKQTGVIATIGTAVLGAVLMLVNKKR